MDEIWGCVKYVGIPYDTVMRLPIQNRRYFIMRHNEEQEKLMNERNGTNKNFNVYGEGANKLTENIQNNPKAGGGF